MEETVDLRSYLITLRNNWKWLLGAFIITSTVIVIVNFLLPTNYQATALVFVVEPQEIIQFDPRIQPTLEEQPTRAYPELATSDQILQELLTKLGSQPGNINSVNDLRNITTAETGSDPNLIRLKANAENPEVASNIANIWAELFVVRVNEIYGDQGHDQILYFEEQLSNAEDKLHLTEEALTEFQRSNRSLVITNTLSIQLQNYSDYLLEQQSITLLIQNTQALQELVDKSPNNQEVSYADQLTALTLQLRAFETDLTTFPLFFQINTNSPLTAENVNEQVIELNNLIAILENKLAQNETFIAELEPKIFKSQEELQQLETLENQLNLDYQVAQDTYTILARKVEEERISSNDTKSGAKLVSRAIIPESPSRSQLPFLLLIGGIGSLIFASFIIYFIQWWHNEPILNSN